MQVMTEPYSGIGFEETENQKMISQMVRDFGAREIMPRIMDWDERQEFPLELFKKMGTLGLMGVLVPEEWEVTGSAMLNTLLSFQRLRGWTGLLVYP